jgi:hypothetical protein
MIFGDPGVGAALDFRFQCGVGDAQGLHAFLEAEGVKRVDGKGSMTALGAAETADEPRAGATSRVGEGRIDDLDQLGIAGREAHNGKDNGLDRSEIRIGQSGLLWGAILRYSSRGGPHD